MDMAQCSQNVFVDLLTTGFRRPLLGNFSQHLVFFHPHTIRKVRKKNLLGGLDLSVDGISISTYWRPGTTNIHR